MNTQLAIIRSEGKEHLCYREEEYFVDVSYPMVTFTKGEDDLKLSNATIRPWKRLSCIRKAVSQS